MPLTERQLAYTAGIIDGEGCIRINRQRYGLAMRVHVTNTNKLLVDTLAEWFGGYIWCEAKCYMKNAKPRYIWELSGTKSEDFLRLIEPYLLLKRRQANLALQFRSHVGKTGKRVSPENSQAREAIFIEMRALNQKGMANAAA